jgi:rhomboid protease GluP
MTHLPPHDDYDTQSDSDDKKHDSHPLYGDPYQQTSDEKPKPKTPERRPLVVQQTQQPILTYILIAVNVAIFIYANLLLSGDTSLMVNYDTMCTFSAYAPPILQDLALHRLFTAMFLHGSLMHVLFNMYALYIIGSSVERTFGTLRFGIVYFLGGLLGSIASVMLGDYYVPSIGASGAVFAIWAAEAVHVYRHRQMYAGLARRILLNTGIFLALNLFLGFTNPQIDNWGHIGGFIGGAILTYLAGPRYQLVREISLEGGMRLRVNDANPLQKSQLPIGMYLTAMVILLAMAVFFITPPTVSVFSIPCR